MKAPDGSYEDGFVVPGTSKPPERTARSPNNLERNNPLSLHDEVEVLRPLIPLHFYGGVASGGLLTYGLTIGFWLGLVWDSESVERVVRGR